MNMAIQENIDLKPYNTFGIAAQARYFVTVNTVADAQTLFSSTLYKSVPHLFIGGGSNLLLTRDFDGLVIRNAILGIDVVHEDDDQVTLRVGAGERWHDFVLYCVARQYGGVENLSLIPGTVGAAPMQNIGAYGVEVKDVIVEVQALELASGLMQTFSNEACRFGYRESIFKQEKKDQYFITGVLMRLTKRNHNLHTSYGSIGETLHQLGLSPSVSSISQAVIHIRSSKLPDPAVIGNAGSFFKNPTISVTQHQQIRDQYPQAPGFITSDPQWIKIPAAWLIEQCGWKGKTFNNIGVHPHQALVLVNYGGGEGQKIWQLACDIQRSVQEKFNITLQAEVNVI